MLINSLPYTQNPDGVLLLRPHHVLPLAGSVFSYVSLSAGTRSLTTLSLSSTNTQHSSLLPCWAFQKGGGRGRGRSGRSGGVDRTTDYERRPTAKWIDIYRRISKMVNPEIGVSGVLNQYENSGRMLVKWELCRVVRELRKFRRYKLALEVYEWMNNRMERFRLFSSDMAIQLDLIAKVHGILSAENFFMNLPESLKDKRVFGSLLNAYVGAKEREKAEQLMEQMRKKEYATEALSYNVMMTLYMKLKEFDKVESLISEMRWQNIHLDMYSYNIWMSARGSQGTREGVKEVYEQMKRDEKVQPNWTTYGTMATMYIKLGHFEEAEECLRGLESRIIGRNRVPYHYLINLYGSLGNKEEIYRIWTIYKSLFMTITNWGYHAVINSLVKVGDIPGAEHIYKEWLSVKSCFDARIANILFGWYVKEGQSEIAENFFDHMSQEGELNSGTWEILGEGRIREERISDALACFRKAASADGCQYWRPKPVNVSSFLELCEKEGDEENKVGMIELLKQLGCFGNETYQSLLSEYSGLAVGSDETEQVMDKYRSSDLGDRSEESENDDADILLSMAE